MDENGLESRGSYCALHACKKGGGGLITWLWLPYWFFWVPPFFLHPVLEPESPWLLSRTLTIILPWVSQYVDQPSLSQSINIQCHAIVASLFHNTTFYPPPYLLRGLFSYSFWTLARLPQGNLAFSMRIFYFTKHKHINISRKSRARINTVMLDQKPHMLYWRESDKQGTDGQQEDEMLCGMNFG